MSSVQGSTTLLRLVLRRDRAVAPLWAMVFAFVAGGSAAATVDLYPDPADRINAAELINANPSLVAFYGRVWDPSSLGAVSMVKLTGLGTLFVGVFAYLLVIRHTRADEELGRTELVAAGAVGRQAPLAAALAEVAIVSLALGLATAGALAATGLPVGGSFAFGASWTTTGVAFGAVGAVAAQLTRTARAARGLAATALGVAYVLRAIGDSGPESGRWISWLSPVGWAQQVRPFAGDRWSVLLLLVAFSGIAVGVAVRLGDSRDLGAGLIADRPGPASAGPRLGSVAALAWRLNRGALLAWSVGVAVLGSVLGSVASNVGDALESDRARELIEKLGGVTGLADAFISTEIGFMAILASVFAVSALSRLHAEEVSGRAEAVLSTTSTRWSVLGAHLVVALVGATWLLLVIGVTLGASDAVVTASWDRLFVDIGAAAARLPAVWVMTGLATLLYGATRSLALAWTLLGAFVVLGEFGPVMDLPAWAQHLSPFAHVPSLPGGDLKAPSLVLLTLLAVCLVLAGLTAFRRRDVSAG